MSTDWLDAMRAAARLDAATAIAEPDDDLVAPVPWQRLGEGERRIDVQVIESSRLGRKLLVIELDADDQETQRRIVEALTVSP